MVGACLTSSELAKCSEGTCNLIFLSLECGLEERVFLERARVKRLAFKAIVSVLLLESKWQGLLVAHRQFSAAWSAWSLSSQGCSRQTCSARWTQALVRSSRDLQLPLSNQPVPVQRSEIDACERNRL